MSVCACVYVCACVRTYVCVHACVPACVYMLIYLSKVNVFIQMHLAVSRYDILQQFYLLVIVTDRASFVLHSERTVNDVSWLTGTRRTPGPVTVTLPLRRTSTLYTFSKYTAKQ